MTKGLDTIIEGIMSSYKISVPTLETILTLLQDKKIINSIADIENDHFAFRTIGIPQLGIESLAPIFTHYGYFRKEFLHFKEKKLDAYWFSPPSEKYPRIFISEIKVELLSSTAQQIIHKYTNHLTTNPALTLNKYDLPALCNYINNPQYPLPSYEEYKTLKEESEYASWVLVNQNKLNHFTFSVHNFSEPYDSLENFTLLLEENGITLNEAGGKIKVSPDKKLLQSSTVASKIEQTLSDGKYKIPSSYIEFAERKPLAEFENIPKEQLKRVHRREGFEAANADKIFESTYSSQIDSKK
jgi:hypothetical protein